MKRIFDLIVSSILIVILSPIMLIITILILLFHGRPITFRQVRPGLAAKPFTIYKFRSMLDLVDEQGNKLPDKERTTKIGLFLRTTSMDELPELFNVVLGQMSLVGPRPLLMRYLDRYNPEQARRHDVRPGITGLAQISGRNAISWEEKFELDLLYVDNHNLWLDIKILLRTIGFVFSRKGISPEDAFTMPDFEGNIDESHM